MRRLMIDLFAGRGGASQAMRARGWRVHRVDSDPRFDLEEIADLTDWSWRGTRPDLIWASPPCTEFSCESMPWCRTGAAPSLLLVGAAMRIIAECEPRFWVIENVRGASRHLSPLLGKPQIVGPFFLWSNLPPLGVSLRGQRHKESYPSSRPDLRAMVPTAISEAVEATITQQRTLWSVL